MGVKIKGPDLKTIEKVGLKIESLLKEVPGVKSEAVLADRIVGKPYLEIHLNREKMARFGMTVERVQSIIEMALGGMTITRTVEGRERYPVRIRYQRERRDNIESLGNILVSSPNGAQLPLREIAQIKYTRGPMVIKSEDTFLIGYVLFDKQKGFAETDVVETAQKYLKQKIASGELKIPSGVSYSFAGNYENQVRSQKTLRIVLPIAMAIIFIILYLQFKSFLTTGIIFTGILVAWSGGFLLLWAYSQEWFLNIQLGAINVRELLQIRPTNLSVAVWVGFLALFGIATDDGVVMCTYLDQIFNREKPANKEAIRKSVRQAARRRIRPCLMTSATTLLALLPIFTSTGRGSDIMVPMAIPSFGGMLVVLISVFVVPTLYSLAQEQKLRHRKTKGVPAMQ